METKIPKREFLQLAKTFRPTEDNIAGWLLSEKLDGVRCLWDGGISRGMATMDVPWAGLTDPRTGYPKDTVKPVATGLWSQYGNPIIVPDGFLDRLPPFALDGQLWAGRGNLQLSESICGGDDPDPRFMEHIKFAVFSSPPVEALFRTGLINNRGMLVDMDFDQFQVWVMKNNLRILGPLMYSTLEQELFALSGWDGWDEQLYILHQIVLNNNPAVASTEVGKYTKDFLDNGAEGVILRDPLSRWTPKRSKGCLSFKPSGGDTQPERTLGPYLQKLQDEALKEHREGLTKPFDFDGNTQ